MKQQEGYPGNEGAARMSDSRDFTGTVNSPMDLCVFRVMLVHCILLRKSDLDSE